MPILIILDIRTIRTQSVTQDSVNWTGCVRLTWVRNSHLLCVMLEKNAKLCFQILQILSDNRIVRFQAWSSNPRLKSSVHFSDSACSLHFFPQKDFIYPSQFIHDFSLSLISVQLFFNLHSLNLHCFSSVVSLLAHQVPVSSLQTPYYLFLCFTYNPRRMCDRLRSFLPVFGFPFHLQWFPGPVSPFLGFCKKLSTPPHLPGFFYS